MAEVIEFPGTLKLEGSWVFESGDGVVKVDTDDFSYDRIIRLLEEAKLAALEEMYE